MPYTYIVVKKGIYHVSSKARFSEYDTSNMTKYICSLFAEYVDIINNKQAMFIWNESVESKGNVSIEEVYYEFVNKVREFHEIKMLG